MNTATQIEQMRAMLSKQVPTPADGSPGGECRRVAELVPLHGLISLATAAPGCEPSHEELVALLRTGTQPYPVVVYGESVLYGWALLRAAKAAGLQTVAVSVCPACDGLSVGDLLLKAIGLHHAASVGDRAERRHPVLRPARELLRRTRRSAENSPNRESRSPYGDLHSCLPGPRLGGPPVPPGRGLPGRSRAQCPAAAGAAGFTGVEC